MSTIRQELDTFNAQLQQVETAISLDPDNAELCSLRNELKELISLTETTLASEEATVAPKAEGSSRKSGQASSTWSAGDECLAKYSGDGSWYPARITSIGGSEEKRVYSVVFKDYNSTELLVASAIKPLPPSHHNTAPVAGVKRKITKEEEDERERKKKKNEKKLEVKAQKAKEQNSKQQTWQKFAKKQEKKGAPIAGVSGTSIFKTPDNPLGKGACCSGT